MLEEFSSVIRRPKFRLSQDEAKRAIQLVAEVAEIVETVEHRRVVPDYPDDDVVINTAVAGRADYVVTGDKALLAIGVYQGIEIVPVARFLQEVLKV